MVLLKSKQLDRLSEFSANLSLVFIGGLLAPIFAGVDSLQPIDVGLALVGILGSLTLSILLIRK